MPPKRALQFPVTTPIAYLAADKVVAVYSLKANFCTFEGEVGVYAMLHFIWTKSTWMLWQDYTLQPMLSTYQECRENKDQ